ncbi:MAG TPA: condensation domain-containing protein, partial [Herpetosiphonaceae bacterium]|nr:condensation domain-containing protein [Herpetosiphonaceae bacterium]
MSELSRRIANLSPQQRVLLEQRLTMHRAETGAENRATVRPRDRAQPAPLSFAQQRLWFLAQLDTDSPQFTVAAGLRLRGILDVDALRRALETIVERHEVLRTTYASIDGTPIQVIGENRRVEVPLVDLSGEAESQRDAEIARLVEQTRQHRFDLSRDLPLQAALLRLGSDEHILLMAWHHIASDNWSAGVFDRELSALYDAFACGEPLPLPELPIQYGDFAVWQRERLQGPLLETHLNYWRTQLGDSPPSLDLPTDRPRPRVQTFQGAEEVVQIPRMLSEALLRLSRQEDATLFMTLVAAFKTLLYRYSGQTDVLVGTPISGRQAVETENLLGLFLNTLVLRSDFNGDPSFRELLRRVRTVALGAFSHQDLPFERLVEELRIERDLSRAPLFQVMFNLRNRARPPLELAGL